MRLHTLWVFALCVPVSVSLAQAQDMAPRTRVDVRQPPWTGVGKLQAVGGSLRVTCTAAIVSERTVLTAAHCLYNPRTRRYFPADSLHFLAGYEGAAYGAAAKGVDLMTPADFDPV